MPKGKILVVEDEGIVAEDIKMSLQRLGFVVPATAASGEEAIRKTEEHNPDLVLMDIVLQGETDGIDAANQICSRFNIPIVYLTAYSDEGMLERAKITEPIGYILKPYNEKELLATIEMALYQYKTGRRKRELLYVRMMEYMPDAVVVTNSDGKIRLVNDQAENIFGYKREELIGRPIEILIPERFKKAHIGHREGYYSDPRTRPMGVLDLYARRKDGSEFPVDISLSPVNTDEGLLVVSDIRDITDRKAIERNLKTKTEQLEAVTRAMISFLDSRDWQGASSIIIHSALGQTDSEYGFVGVAVNMEKGPVLRIFAIEGIDWDKNVGLELYENAMRSFREIGYLEFTKMDNLFGKVITTGGVVISNDPANDPRSGGRLPEGHPSLRSFLGVPILKGGQVVGMIGVANRQGGYTLDDQAKIEILCHASSVLYDSYLRHQKEIAMEEERNKQEEEIHHLAYYDMLTDLPNRLTLHDSVERAITAGRSENKAFSLLIINLNRFKEVNNTLGHHNGDLILQQIAARLRGLFCEPNTVARLGGDAFAVLLPGADAGVAKGHADRIVEVLRDPFAVVDFSTEVSASIGISVYPGHGEDTHTLIRRAEIAMYEAKRAESGWQIYSARVDQYSPERLTLITDLHHAVDANQLFLVYQPKIDLRSGRTIGVEALVRWQHPRSGTIPPNQFIFLAEHTGMIKHITFWVIREAVRQARTLHQMGFEIHMAANLSAKNIQPTQLLDLVKGHLATWGVTAQSLRLEITESTIMADPELAMEVLTQLNQMGVCFSVDDFGTGYSSLSYLQRLPVDEVKIDKSFVLSMMTDKGSATIVRSIIELGHNLGIKVTAEGVEDRETFDRLISLGCDAAQGYLISRPIPQAEIIEWLKIHSAGPG